MTYLSRWLLLGAMCPLTSLAQNDVYGQLFLMDNKPVPYTNCITDDGGTECREVYSCDYAPEWFHQRDGSLVVRTPCQNWSFQCGVAVADSPGDTCVWGQPGGGEIRIKVIEEGFIITGGDPVVRYGASNE